MNGVRRTAVRVVTTVLAVFWGFLFFGLIDLLAFLQGPDFHDSILLSTGWGLVFLVLVAAPLAAVAVKPQIGSAAAEVSAVAVAVAIAAGLSSSPKHLWVTLGLLVTVGAVAALSRVGPLPVSWRWSAGPVLLVALAVVPAASYAWTAARTTGTGVTTDDTAGLDHWPIQAALPIALLLIAALAAGHPLGWRLPLWTGTVATVWFGVVALAEPTLVGSLDRGWSVAVLVWAVGFAVVTLRTAPVVLAPPRSDQVAPS